MKSFILTTLLPILTMYCLGVIIGYVVGKSDGLREASAMISNVDVTYSTKERRPESVPAIPVGRVIE